MPIMNMTVPDVGYKKQIGEMPRIQKRFRLSINNNHKKYRPHNEIRTVFFYIITLFYDNRCAIS